MPEVQSLEFLKIFEKKLIFTIMKIITFKQIQILPPAEAAESCHQAEFVLRFQI